MEKSVVPAVNRRQGGGEVPGVGGGAAPGRGEGGRRWRRSDAGDLGGWVRRWGDARLGSEGEEAGGAVAYWQVPGLPAARLQLLLAQSASAPQGAPKPSSQRLTLPPVSQVPPWQSASAAHSAQRPVMLSQNFVLQYQKVAGAQATLRVRRQRPLRHALALPFSLKQSDSWVHASPTAFLPARVTQPPLLHAWFAGQVSTTPFGKGAQTPGVPPPRSHEVQSESQALMQHTPSTQNPVRHSPGVLQGAPGSLAQTHVVPSQ